MDEATPFLMKELLQAYKDMKKGKASGPDALTNKIVKQVVIQEGEYFLQVLNKLL